MLDEGRFSFLEVKMANKFVIMADACCDLPLKELKEQGIIIIPMEISIGKDLFLSQGNDVPASIDLYARIKKGEKVGISNITTSTYLNIMRPYLDEGFDILLVTVSSALSSNFSQGFNAINILINEYPERTLKILDTMSCNTGIDLVLTQLAKDKQMGKNVLETFQDGYNFVSSIHTWIAVDDFNKDKHFSLLGRSSDFLRKSLGMRPVLHIDECGNVIGIRSVKTQRAATNALFNHVNVSIIQPTKQEIFISYDINLKEAEFLKAKLLQDVQVKEVILLQASSVTTIQSGLNLLTVSYVGKKRNLKRPI
jgi:DegV family protein with EDD domain